MSRLRRAAIPLGIVFAAAALSLVLVRMRPAPPMREPSSPLPSVTTSSAVLGTGPIPVYGAGTVRPTAEIDIAPRVGGTVVWVNPSFRGGGRIAQGDPLFRIDDADYRNRVQQARANVAAQQVAVLQAEEDARIARAEYALFLARHGNTAGSDAATPLALREPQLAAARAALARDSAALADAELALSRTQVAAPFSGIVRAESVALGQLVAAGASVGRFYADDAVEVSVSLSDGAAALIPELWQLAPGDEDDGVAATVTARYGETEHSWPGYVDRARRALDERTRTIDVVVRVPDPHPREGVPLLVGQFVEVRIEGIQPERYFLVPREALRSGNELWALRAEDADDGGSQVTIVPVHVHQGVDDTVFVGGALVPGQALVTGGIEYATEGMRVRR